MENEIKNGLGTGALQKPWDDRNVVYEEVAGAAPFDWNKGYRVQDKVPLIVNDQGSQLSCTGQAWAKKKEAQEFLQNKIYRRFAPKFIYSRTFEPQGGAYLYRGAANVLVPFGVPLESTDPSYQNGRPVSEGDIRAIDNRPSTLIEAAPNKAKTHAYVGNSIDEWASAIEREDGIIGGFTMSNQSVYDADKNEGYLRLPSAGEPTLGHAVLYTGAYLWRGTRILEHIGSWGLSHGVGGYFKQGEDWFRAGTIWSGITLLDIENPIEQPHQPGYNFMRDLFYGVSGEDVRQLQKYLNTTPFKVAITGQGSPGNETRFFGNLTRTAVASWQTFHKVTPAIGYFGKKSRAKYRELTSQ